MNLFNAHKECKEWMAAFGQETPEKFTEPDVKTRFLRARLVSEEMLETLQGLGYELTISKTILSDPDHPDRPILSKQTSLEPVQYDNLETLDGLGDSLFVIIGTLVAFGVDTQLVWNEILRSNWTKMWTPKEVVEFGVEETRIEGLMLAKPFDYQINHNKHSFDLAWNDRTVEHRAYNDTSRIWLCKNINGKVIKSPSFTPPNLKQFLPK